VASAGTRWNHHRWDSTAGFHVYKLSDDGRCEPRGGGTADGTIATVVKARDGDGLWATSPATNKTLMTRAQSCAVLRRTLIEELLHVCSGSEGTLLPHVATLAY
jgi:hypothetical protein